MAEYMPVWAWLTGWALAFLLLGVCWGRMRRCRSAWRMRLSLVTEASPESKPELVFTAPHFCFAGASAPCRGCTSHGHPGEGSLLHSQTLWFQMSFLASALLPGDDRHLLECPQPPGAQPPPRRGGWVSLAKERSFLPFLRKDLVTEAPPLPPHPYQV